jgi:hypothetical protein
MPEKKAISCMIPGIKAHALKEKNRPILINRSSLLGKVSGYVSK